MAEIDWLSNICVLNQYILAGTLAEVINIVTRKHVLDSYTMMQCFQSHMLIKVKNDIGQLCLFHILLDEICDIFYVYKTR